MSINNSCYYNDKINTKRQVFRQDPKTVAVAGGVVTGTGNKQYFNGYKFHKISKSTNRDIYCLAFLSLKTEKPKLLSYSLVISNEISAEEFKEELIKVCSTITVKKFVLITEFSEV